VSGTKEREMIVETMEMVMVGWVCDGEDEEGWIQAVDG
jgi:hypothetical protein